jgi:hypothetical protein
MTDQIRSRHASGRRYAVPAVLAVIVLVLGSIILLDPLDLDLRGSDASNAAHVKRPAPVQVPAATVGAARGRLGSFVYHFVDVLSRHRTYTKPRPAQRARLALAFRALKSGRLGRSAALAKPLGYKVVRFRDLDTGRRLVLLVERRLPGRGWGLYVHLPKARSRLVVEVAHPAADVKSERVGLEVFEAAKASDLFVAGAHRHAASDDSSDVAHNTSTVFDAVHRAVVAPRVTVFQPHGFDSSNRGDQYGSIVLSSGGAPAELHRSLANALEAESFKVCLYQDGRCEGLGATTNVQGDSARAAGASFVHLEMALRLRENADTRARIASTVGSCLAGALGVTGPSCKPSP